MAKIAFLGLGAMGLPMSLNLVRAGHEVVGYDPLDTARRTMAQLGGTATDILQEALDGADTVFSIVPTSAHVADAYLGSEGVIENCRPNTLLIDCSTIDIETTREIALAAKSKGLPMLDAPVSGGVAKAKAGTLTFMIGGQSSTFERAKAVLGALGKEMIHVGPSGAGQGAKICNNAIAGAHIIAAAEALALGRKIGLDLQALAEVIGKSSGASWVMENYCPAPGIVDAAPSNDGYRSGFASSLMAKDIRLFQSAARKNNISAQLIEKAQTIYQDVIELGFGDMDCTVIYKLLSDIDNS